MKTYSHPKVVQFVNDMEDEGIEVEHYHGRFYWEGPAVRTDRNGWPTLQDVIRATSVKVQWDSLGLDQIVYPIASDAGVGEDDEPRYD